MNTDQQGDHVVTGWHDLSSFLPTSAGWQHSGVAVDAAGTIYCAHPDGHALLRIGSGGTSIIPVPFAELHGISLSEAPGQIAIADPGWRMQRTAEEIYEESTTPGRAAVISVDDGSVIAEYAEPVTATYRSEGWRPTSITIMPNGPTGAEVWVADGYGLNRLHRFTAKGEHLTEVFELADGTYLDCPHAVIAFQDTTDTPRLLVADRGNHRLLVLDTEGRLVTETGTDVLDSPSGLAVVGESVYVTELSGGLAAFTLNWDFKGYLERGRRRNRHESEWPNRPGATLGHVVGPEPPPGVLNSPHGLAAHNGSLFLTEWMINGRLARIDLSKSSLRIPTSDKDVS